MWACKGLTRHSKLTDSCVEIYVSEKKWIKTCEFVLTFSAHVTLTTGVICQRSDIKRGSVRDVDYRTVLLFNNILYYFMTVRRVFLLQKKAESGMIWFAPQSPEALFTQTTLISKFCLVSFPMSTTVSQQIDCPFLQKTESPTLTDLFTAVNCPPHILIGCVVIFYTTLLALGR